jgi:hypothetical protein
MHIPQNERPMPLSVFPEGTMLIKGGADAFMYWLNQEARHDWWKQTDLYQRPAALLFPVMPSKIEHISMEMNWRDLERRMMDMPLSSMWDIGHFDSDSTSLTEKEKALARLMALKFSI